MFKRRRTPLLIALICLIVPAVAVAGTGTAGTQRVSLATKVSPAQAGSQHVTLKVKVGYESTTAQPIKNDTNQIRLTLPAGMTVNVHGAAQCLYSKLSAAKGAVSVCPKGSIVGTGSTTIDARPLVATPLTFPVTLYNVKGVHYNDVMLYVHTQFGNVFDFFNVLPGTREILRFEGNPPTTPDTYVGTFSLKTVAFTLRDGSGGKSYISAPATCHRTWAFGISISSFPPSPGAAAPPAVSATSSVPCTAGTAKPTAPRTPGSTGHAHEGGSSDPV